MFNVYGSCKLGVGSIPFLVSCLLLVKCKLMTTLSSQGRVTKEVPLHSVFNRTGDVWHIFLPDLESNLLYGYRVSGRYILEEGACYDPRRILVDPYAKVKLITQSLNLLSHKLLLLMQG